MPLFFHDLSLEEKLGETRKYLLQYEFKTAWEPTTNVQVGNALRADLLAKLDATNGAEKINAFLNRRYDGTHPRTLIDFAAPDFWDQVDWSVHSGVLVPLGLAVREWYDSINK